VSNTTVTTDPAISPTSRLVMLGKRLGVAGIFVFTIKGMLWLLVPAALAALF